MPGWHDAPPPSGPTTWQGDRPAPTTGQHDALDPRIAPRDWPGTPGTPGPAGRTGEWPSGPGTGQHDALAPPTAPSDWPHDAPGPDTGTWHHGPPGPGTPTGEWPGATGGTAGPPTAPPTDWQGWQGWQDGTSGPPTGWHEDRSALQAPEAPPVGPYHPGPPLADDGYHPADDGYQAPEPTDDRPGGPGRRSARRQAPTGLDDGPKLPRVPGFDGLRALALVAVLAFHQGYDLVRGGFLGISSLFTLSGFLVATLALAEWAQTGRLALGRFWERRVRRIVPGVLVTLAAVVVLQVVLRVGSGPSFRGDVLWALGYATNWRSVATGDDIAAIFIVRSPVQHLWSVALVVQLLVIVPLAFVGLMTVTRRHWRATGAVFALVAVASFVAAHLAAQTGGNGGIAYFGTHTRAGELLVGVALAYAVLSPALRRVLESEAGVAAVRYGGPAALVVLVWLWHSTSLGDPRLFGGITALNAVLTAWVVLAATTPGPTATVLGAWPLQTLGRFALAAYLVHWPVYLTIDTDLVDLNGNLLFGLRVAATLVLGVLITLAVERPFRERLRVPRPQLATVLGGATVVIAAAVMVLPIQPPPDVSLTVDDGSGPGDLDAVAPDGQEAASFALVGDSLAASLAPGFETWNAGNADRQVRVHTHVSNDCPPSAPGPVELAGETIGEQTACVGWEPRLPRLLDRAEADAIVVVAGVDEVGQREIDRELRHLGDPLFDAWLAGELASLADTLAEPGVPVLWATVPHVRMPGPDGDWTRLDDNDPQRIDRLNELIREAASGRDGFQVVDLTAAMQELPQGGEFSPDAREEGRTLTADGADRMAEWLVPEVLEALDTGDAGGSGGGAGEAGGSGGGTSDDGAPTGEGGGGGG